MLKLITTLLLLLGGLMAVGGCDIFVSDRPDTVIVRDQQPDTVIVQEDKTPDIVIHEDKTPDPPPDVNIHIDGK
jgi:hypothetical protein